MKKNNRNKIALGIDSLENRELLTATPVSVMGQAQINVVAVPKAKRISETVYIDKALIGGSQAVELNASQFQASGQSRRLVVSNVNGKIEKWNAKLGQWQNVRPLTPGQVARLPESALLRHSVGLQERLRWSPASTNANQAETLHASDDSNETAVATLFGIGKRKANGARLAELLMNRRIARGIVANPGSAFKFSPFGGTDTTPVSPGAVQIIPVSTLQTNYETAFGDLNAKLRVTLNSRQNVDKINYVKSQAATGYFDLLAKPIQNNTAGVTAVSFQPVNYQTNVVLPAGAQSFQVSGGLMMPQGIDKSQIKGVVVYFHGTTFSKSEVPSNYNFEAQLCAELYASQGYIVVAPDYVGQGADWQNVHPYVLYPEVSAKTAVDMLAAVKPLIASQYQIAPNDPALKLFSVGYSEGGAYSLWFNSYNRSNPGILDPMFALTHSVGLEGAYNTSNVVKNFLFSEVSKANNNPFNIQTLAITNFVKPLLSAVALLSFGTYSMNGKLDNVFDKNFLAMNASYPVSQTLCNLDGAQVTIPQAFAQPDTSCAEPLFFAALNKRANKNSYLAPVLLDPATAAGKALLRLHLSQSSKNNVYSLLSSYMTTKGGQAILNKVLAAADVNLTPCTNDGVSIITLADDSVVTPNNFDTLVKAYPDKIANQIKLNQDNFMVVSAASKSLGYAYWVPVDHMQALTYEFIYALHIFNTYTSA